MKFAVQWLALVLGAALTFYHSNVSGAEALYHNPVIPGDHPDPSIIRDGDDFWSVCTSSEWGPQFPLMHSRDLINWETKGAVFAQRPSWASGNFWAPEISEDQGRFFVYYAARIKGGPMAVAVAIAEKPEGPYHDQGPMVSQADGSIDPAPATDERGQRYLIWKEDGNSRGVASTIWAQPLDAEGIRVTGHPSALISSDTAWEGKVVEGPFILHRADWFYLFYSGNGCCGRGCNYALGVARSHSLLGPWEKNPANPILAGNEAWHCPGHGSIVQDQHSRYWFLYHGYSTNGFVFTGRQGLLDEVLFGPDDWPTINHGNGPSTSAPTPFGDLQVPPSGVRDDFGGDELQPGWQWPQENEPGCQINNNVLALSPSSPSQTNIDAALVAQSMTTASLTATVRVETAPEKLHGMAGLAIVGDAENALGLSVGQGRMMQWERKGGQFRVVAEKPLPAAEKVELQMTARPGGVFSFAARAAGGAWDDVGPEAGGNGLSPWDRGLRIGLTVGGESSAQGRFEQFHISPLRPNRAAAAAGAARVVLTVGPPAGRELPGDFLGMSFGTKTLLPDKSGAHFFSPSNQPLVELFRALGLRHLRIGGTTVESPVNTPIPNHQDIDQLFAFVQAAGVKRVIYSLRLLETNAGQNYAAVDAEIARYIWSRYHPYLDCFALGNEPDRRAIFRQDWAITNLSSYLARWRLLADAVTKEVPGAQFGGPDAGSGNITWTTQFARAEKSSGLLSIVTEHFYVGGAGRGLSPEEAIEQLLSERWLAVNQRLYDKMAAPVMAEGLPYRFTEANDHYTGGVRDGSDTMAGALWALDFLHWWAAHDASGVDFHNTQWVANDILTLDKQRHLRPTAKACGLKAFALGGAGRGEQLIIANPDEVNLTAYARVSAEGNFVTVINKEHGAAARVADVLIDFPESGRAEVLFLRAPDDNAAAKSGLLLGGAPLDAAQPWNGQWTPLGAAENGRCKLAVPPTSAAIVKLSPP